MIWREEEKQNGEAKVRKYSERANIWLVEEKYIYLEKKNIWTVEEQKKGEGKGGKVFGEGKYLVKEG